MASLNSILSGSLVFRDQGTFLSEIRPGINSVNITGSLNVSGSTITFNGSNLVERLTTLESGQGADQVKFGAITLWTASINEWTSSAKSKLTDLQGSTEALGSYTASANLDVSELYNSASIQDVRILSVENTSSNQEVRIKAIESIAIVSSSAQIYDLGFLTASIGGIISSSGQITRLGYITGSKFSELDDIPQGIISSSTQIDDLFNLDGIVSASNNVVQLQNTDLQVTGSLHLNFNGVSNYFQIDINGEEKVKVNEEGIFSLSAFSSNPTPVRGGLFFGDDDNLYLGVND